MPLRAVEEIEILSFSPRPPASLDGIVRPSPGDPWPPPTSSNTVTVVVRYRTDGAATGVEVYPHVSTGAAPIFQSFAPVGSVPWCGRITGPSSGECAEAFALICDERSPASITIDRVGASLTVSSEGRVLARDEAPGSYTFYCSPRPPEDDFPNDCRVIGAGGVPGPSSLPFGRDLPICRCLRDDGARELRCGLLHPDFFLLRRVPLPLVPGKEVSEVWEFLPLTKLDGPVRVVFTGGGLTEPMKRTFGEGGKLQPGAVERFSLTIVGPKAAAVVPGLASFEYEMRDAESAFARKFGVDRTIAESMFEPR
jgi:hypothetical protein